MEDMMATATVALQPATSRWPLWLSRLHSWWFMAQVGANLIATWFIVRLMFDGDWPDMGIGLLLGQGFLLSLWLALGGLPNVARFVSVLLVTLIAALAVGDQSSMNPNFASWVEQASQVFIVCFFMVLLFHGLLLPLRWLLGWRLDFDTAYHAPSKAGRYQVGIIHFLGWTTFLAIPCGILRLIEEDPAEIATTCLTVFAMTLPIAASFALAIVGRSRWRWTFVAVALFGIMWTAETFLPNLDLIVNESFLKFNLGIVAAVAGNLVVLRLFGLKLFSVAEQPAPVSAERENPVKSPHFQLQPTMRTAVEAAAGS